MKQRYPYKLKIPLRLALIVPFMLLTAGTTGLVGYLSWWNGQRSVNMLANQLMRKMGDRVNHYLNDYLEMPFLINRINAGAVRLEQIDITNPESLERHFLEQIQTFRSVSRIYFSNPQGGLVSVSGNDERGLAVAATENFGRGTLQVYEVDEQGNRISLFSEREGYDASDRPFYRSAVEAEEPTWSPIYVYVPATRGLGIAASFPLYEAGQFQGVLSSDLSLAAISQFLAGLEPSPRGEILIMERSGFIVASSTNEPPFRASANGEGRRLAAIDSEDLLISSAAQHLQSQFGDLTHINTNTQLRFAIEDEQQFLQVTPFTDEFGLDWLIVIVVPESDFMGQIDANTRTIALLSLAALLGSIALGLWLTRSLVRPIQQLGQASSALADGTWEQNLQTNSSIVELQVLNTSFKRMAEQLQQSFDRVKAALQESEEKFTKVFRTCPDPIGIATPDGQYIEVNDAFVQLFGYAREEVVGRMAVEVGHWVNPEERLQYVAALQANQPIHNQEFVFRSKAGKLLTVLFSAERLEVQGQTYIVGIAKDITDRKQAELELQQQKDLRESIYNESTDALFLVDPETLLIIDCNRRAVELFEVDSPVDLIGMEGRTLQHHPFTAQEMDEIVGEMQQRGFWSREIQYVTCKGNLFWGNLAATVVQIAQQTIHLVRVTDITDRKRAEETLHQQNQALRDSEERFRHAFHDAPIGMAMIGIDDRWLKVNPMLCEMLGYSEAEVLTRTASALVHPEDTHKLQHCIEQVQASETRNAQAELRYCCAGGRLAWGFVSLSLVRDAQNQPLYYVAQVQDITDRQAIDHMKNEFISIVSHELRTPLTAIRGFLGLLDTGIYDNKPDKAKHMIRQALTNSTRLVRLVNDILDLERLSSGKAQLEMEICDAEDLMRRAAAGVQSIADEARVSLSIHSATLEVWGAPDSIIQTLTNLLSNAIKFSPPHSEITLSAQPQSDTVLFQVKDQGRGIPPDKLSTIFGRFQQVDASDARLKGGTGLGLAICQNIVQQHGGNIWAESVLGEGSTFYFTLPTPAKNP
jgi:PAS domain S-box-containing protein